MKIIKQYLFNLFISYDRSLNATLGGNPNETISSRLGRNVNRYRWVYYLCKVLSLIFREKRHCIRSYEDPSDVEASADSPVTGLVIFILLAVLVFYII